MPSVAAGSSDVMPRQAQPTDPGFLNTHLRAALNTSPIRPVADLVSTLQRLLTTSMQSQVEKARRACLLRLTNFISRPPLLDAFAVVHRYATGNSTCLLEVMSVLKKEILNCASWELSREDISLAKLEALVKSTVIAHFAGHLHGVVLDYCPICRREK